MGCSSNNALCLIYFSGKAIKPFLRPSSFIELISLTHCGAIGELFLFYRYSIFCSSLGLPLVTPWRPAVRPVCLSCKSVEHHNSDFVVSINLNNSKQFNATFILIIHHFVFILSVRVSFLFGVQYSRKTINK